MENPCTTEKARRDYVLLRKALDNNDQKAYAELMSLYRDSIYYMLMKIVKNSDDAEDLTLETFGKAFRYLDKYTPQYAFSTWLFRIAVNNSIDYIRHKNNSPQCLEDDLSTANTQLLIDRSQSNTTPTPEQEVIDKQRIRMMRLAVAQLPDKYRKVVELRYYQELSYDEIAEELNISLSNVKIQLLRAKNMLSQIMVNVKNSI
ncbi:MAG: sigma-70 family RNA polymerase sigma factor [Bacteroidales bacterium]|nr:sigma-70 family RNA polymerase sigma factor [Bacteroidales bacterium]MBO7587543.1 sigma-70 family RNA polymerase sigma factor [Bacteroidales bacterium]MBQ4441918.1 sigma-70 family RNA polymerase sigma factor [Bacteroidales bacterium]